MKRYIVTEAQLEVLADMAVRQWESGLKWGQAFKEIRKASIPEWATHFAGDLIAGCEFMQAEEIK